MLDRKTAPQFSKDFSWSIPSFHEEKLPNGIDLYLYDRLDQKVLKFDLVFKSGRWFESKSGQSYFTAHLLEKGSKRKRSDEIADLMDRYGAQIEISPGPDFVTLSAYCLVKNLRDVISLVTEFVTEPSFDEDEFGSLKTIYRQNLKVNNEKTGFLASKLIRQKLFGENHPYGSSVEETDVDALSLESLREFHEMRFVPAQLYVTGPVSASDVEWIRGNFSGFRQRQPEGKSHMLKAVPEKLFHQPKDSSVQCSIRLGKRSINKAHEEYPGLVVLNHILGGYFGSRLMKNIREEKGLTYGIYSSQTFFLNDSMFSIGADVNKENVDLTISEIKKELSILSERLIGEEELITAKNHLLGSMQLDSANPFSVLEKVKNLRVFRLPESHYSNLVEQISAVSPRQLQSIAQKYLQAEELLIVTVG